jgi:phage gp29-like protein
MGIVDKSIKGFKNLFNYTQVLAPQVNNPKNLGSKVMPLQLQRIKQDTLTWREGIEEAERALVPFRVKMQETFVDTVLNGHVSACIERRKDLTLLRDWQIVNVDGTNNEDVEKILDSAWFNQFISFSLDTIFFGYTLISLGDIKDGKFNDIEVVKRWNISPDRKVVSAVPYDVNGVSFEDAEFINWHIYIKTVNDIGSSKCGFGLLYSVALYEIFLRNILGYNGDFVELYSQPYRIGKTNKTQGIERDTFEDAVANMGSAGYAILDAMDDTIEFLDSSLGGTGFKGYADLEQRIEKKISKLILGHADALDSTSGKLGSNQGEDNPTSQALKDKQTKDGVFVTDVINCELLPRLKNLGFAIPDGVKFEFKNDSEQNENNKNIVAMAVEIKKAGLQISKEYFEEQTGIKLVDLPAVELNPTPSQTIKNKLENLYK